MLNKSNLVDFRSYWYMLASDIRYIEDQMGKSIENAMNQTERDRIKYKLHGIKIVKESMRQIDKEIDYFQ